MQAIILAGGMGTRLRPLTQELPKPMVPLLGKPLMEHSIDLLKKYGINKIGVTLMFLPQYVKNYFKDGSEFGVELSYFVEEKPLGTAGSIKLAEDFLDDTFIVISGDSLTSVNLEKILKYHKSINADVTIVLSKQSEPLAYGVVLTDTTGKVTSFVEKPQWENVFSDTVNTGIYIIEKKVLDKIQKNKEFDFSKDLFPLLLKENYNLYGYITEEYWCDLGTAKSYLNANIDTLSGTVFGKKFENVLCKNVTVSENVKLIPPVFIDENTIINGNCTIGPNVVVGKNCIIENSDISNSVLWDKNIVNRCDFSNNILGNNNTVDSCVLSGNNVIGSNVKINKMAHVKHNVNVCDNSEIASEAIVENNYINHFDNLKKFNDNGIDGIWNHDINSETFLGIASSFKAEKILISSNKTELGCALASLCASYCSLCGANVYITSSNEASCRFFSQVNKIKSIYIFEINETVNIQMIDDKGLNISHNQERTFDFNKKDFENKRGKIIRLNSIDKDFEYFLNSSIPFCKKNIQISSNEKYRLHNLIWEDNEFDGKINTISSASILAKNGSITDLFDEKGKLSLAAFLRLKCDITMFLGGKSIYMPSYAPDEVINDIKNCGLKLYKKMQHRGDSMQQAEKFTEISVLLEYVPAFFAQALAFYLSNNTIKNDDNVIISRYDFKTLPINACKTIFSLNKNKTGNIVSSNVKGNLITIVPQNNGYIFSAFGKFFKEEYSPDIIEQFVSENTF